MSKKFWKASGLRALRTFLQVILATWTTGQLITELNWKVILMSALSAAVYSILTSIMTGLPEVEYAEHIYMSEDEPEDSWIDEDLYDEDLGDEEEGEEYGEE